MCCMIRLAQVDNRLSKCLLSVYVKLKGGHCIFIIISIIIWDKILHIIQLKNKQTNYLKNNNKKRWWCSFRILLSTIFYELILIKRWKETMKSWSIYWSWCQLWCTRACVCSYLLSWIISHLWAERTYWPKNKREKRI